MERRISERKPIELDVYVATPGHDALRCTVSNISKTGVFLKVNPLYLPMYQQLNLVFALHIKSSNVVRMRRVPALVAWAESDGVGMVFCRNNRSRA